MSDKVELPNKFSFQSPWGQNERFALNEVCTVKLLSVNPNEKLSLQYHHNRDEFWRIVTGSCKIVVGEITHDAKIGDEFFIKRGDKHRIMTTDDSVQIMEISFGEFDEKDIVRLEDKYDRVKG